jgi:hypothetical protein
MPDRSNALKLPVGCDHLENSGAEEITVLQYILNKQGVYM